MNAIDPKAYHGLAGELAKRMEPQMEVAPVAVAVDLLCTLANAVGPGPRTLVAGEYEGANFNVLKVGLTGVAKTYTGKPAHRVLAQQVGWAERVLYDVYTPQALLESISDKYRDGEDLVERPAIEKQRLLRVDEFAVVLNRSKNPEATLLQYMNYAFDGTPIDIASLAARERGGRSTDHFLSCITNVTPETLREHSKLAANGFLNRFLFVWVSRGDRDVPSPERVELDDLAREANKIVRFWRDRGEFVVANTPDAQELWLDSYAELARPRPGVYGQMLARGRIFVPRLSLAFAIADRSDAIEVEHLEAALALWDYHKHSVARVFGTSTGDGYADAILAYLTEHGRAKKEPLNRLCHGKTAVCDRALDLLEEARLIKRVQGTTTPRGGRPPELWELAAVNHSREENH